MSKHILIRSSEATQDLKDLADHEDALIYLRIPTANEAAATTELATIDVSEWIKSGAVVLTSGNIISGILLPEEAGAGR